MPSSQLCPEHPPSKVNKSKHLRACEKKRLDKIHDHAHTTLKSSNHRAAFHSGVVPCRTSFESGEKVSIKESLFGTGRAINGHFPLINGLRVCDLGCATCHSTSGVKLIIDF